MVFQNTKVTHKTFGEGIVTNHEGNYINVSFGGMVKRFVYPDAFDKFLTIDDEDILSAIKIDIAASKKAKQIIIDRKNEENYRAMTRGIVIPGKEANAENENEEDEFRSKENDEF
jgi:hypothetical protein